MQLKTYRYKLMTHQGKILKGLLLAHQGRDVVVLLDPHQNHILRVRQLSLIESFLTRPRVTDQELLNLTSQCLHLLKASIAIQDVIRIISNLHSSNFIQSSLMQIRSQLLSGGKLSQALSAHPFLFDSLYCHTIQVGEEHGALIQAFEKMVSHLNKRADIKRKLKKATFYPAVLLGMMVLLLISLSVFLLPQLKDFILSFGLALSWSTRLLLWLAETFDRFGCYFLLFVVFLFISLGVLYLLSDRFSHAVDRLLLKTPFLGDLLVLYNLMHYVIDFRIFCNDGRSVLKALKQAPEAVSNHCLRKQFQELSEQIHEGKSLTALFLSLPWVPEAVAQMIKVGESSGQLTQALVFSEDFIQSNLWSKIERFLSLLEPLLLLMIGGVLLWIVIAVFLPLYDHLGTLS